MSRDPPSYRVRTPEGRDLVSDHVKIIVVEVVLGFL